MSRRLCSTAPSTEPTSRPDGGGRSSSPVRRAAPETYENTARNLRRGQAGWMNKITNNFRIKCTRRPVVRARNNLRLIVDKNGRHFMIIPVRSVMGEESENGI